MNSPLETLHSDCLSQKRGGCKCKLINILMMGKMPQSVPIVSPTQTKGCAFYTMNYILFLNYLYEKICTHNRAYQCKTV